MSTETNSGRVQGRCPACRGASLFVGDGGGITCARLDCPNPVLLDDLLLSGKAGREVNTPEVRQAIADVLRSALVHGFPPDTAWDDIAASLAGAVYVVMDRASAGMPLDGEGR